MALKDRKKIIDGKLYDISQATEVAEVVVRRKCGKPCGWEVLYRTSNNNWFIYSDIQDYDFPGTGEWIGDDINPISDNEVIEWLETYNQIEVLEKYFPEYLSPA